MAAFSDNFNRANGGLGTNWGTLTGFQAGQIVSNRVRHNAGAGSGSWKYVVTATATFSADQVAQCTLFTNAATDSYCGPLVRASTSASTTYYHSGDSSTGGTGLGKCVAGSFTNLVTDGANIASNDVIIFTVVGAALSSSKNGSNFLATTDSAIASGQPGIVVGENTGVDGDTEIDDFFSSDVSVAAQYLLRGMADNLQAVKRSAFY